MTAGRQSVTLKKDWGTPKKYVLAVKNVFGGDIDLDPCSNKYSVVDALKEYCLPKEDGLKKEWNYQRIYVNPPYGSDKERKTTIKHWLAKCVEAHESYYSEVLALVPVAPNTEHWKKFVFVKACAVCFLYDTRLKFLENGQDTGKGAPMACAMVYWGVHYEKFFFEFVRHGAVVRLSELKNRELAKHHFYPSKSKSRSKQKKNQGKLF